MNFTFYDNFKRFSLSCSDSDLYIAFMSTPYSELHFFDKSTYVGSLVFEDFKNSGYHFELSKLRTLLFSVKSFEDVVDFSRVFSHFNSNTLMLVDANGSYRELSLMGAKRMDFDSKKKISVIPYLINIRDMIEKTYKDKAVGIFVPSDYSGELQKYFKCFSDVSAIGKYDIVVDCFLKTSEYKRLKRENSNLIQADVLVLMLLMPIFLSNLKKVGITLTVIDCPEIEAFELNAEEREALKNKTNIVNAYKNANYLNKVFDKPSEYEYISIIGDAIYGSYSIKETRRFRYVQASNYPFVSVKNGERNYSQPKHTNSIRIFGPCIAYGLFSSDSSSIDSVLRVKCEEMHLKYNIINNGVPDGIDLINDVELMLSKDFCRGDHIVWINHFDRQILSIFASEEAVNSFDLSVIMKGEHFWYLNHPMHCNYRANIKIAETILTCLKNPEQANSKALCLNLPKLDFNVDKTSHYLDQLEREIEPYRSSGKNGAIVINGNPFTSGHQYLVEYASRIVDTLYVFVVENNNRAIPFYYRFNMAKKGCEMFDNVIVLRTGEYFASENTFSAYFNENNSVIDPHEDIEVFANTIAQKLNISMRFFGTEKKGSVTYKFNEICQYELKKRHIEPVIIERKTLNDQSISASTVRKLLAAQDYAGLSIMLPQYSFELLKEIY